MNSNNTGGCRPGERGQAIVVAAIALAAIIAIAAYAINTAEWWNHGHHLQTQADAAVLAAASQYVPGCTGGSTAEQAIANTVAEYDGASTTQANGLTGTSPSNYNQQLDPSTSSGSRIIAEINSNSFGTQDYSGSLTGHPCTDNTLDVKLTEENLSSLIPSVNPGYITAEAQVGFYEETEADKVAPLVFEEDLPTDAWVELVDENSIPGGCNGGSCVDSDVNPSVVLGWAPLSTTVGSSLWSGSLIPGAPSTDVTSGPISFTSTDSSSTGSFPVGLRVVTSAYSTAGGDPPDCPQEFPTAANPEGVVCYDIGLANPGQNDPAETDDGALFTRVYDNPSSETPGTGTPSPAAPQASDVWLVPYTSGTSDCGTSEGRDSSGAYDSNFLAGAATVQLCAEMNFTRSGGTSITCSKASLDLYADPSMPGLSSSTPNMNCPSGGPNGVWYSNPVPLVNSSDPMVSGPTTFRLGWELRTGSVPTEYDSNGTAVNLAVEMIGGAKIGGGNCSVASPCACTDHAATCQGSACTSTYVCAGSFDGSTSGASAAELVQRAFDGASLLLPQLDASYSRAGPITGIDLYNNSTGTCSGTTGPSIQSVARGMSENLTACVYLIPGFTDDISTTSAGDPVALNAGDDDFSGEWDCYEPSFGAAGSDPAGDDSQPFNLEMQWWMEDGCNSDHITDASSDTLSPASPPLPSTDGVPASDQYYWYSVNNAAGTPPTCGPQPSPPSTASNPADCVEGVQDNDITWNLMAALNERILGCTDAQCSTSTPKCNNYWNTSNTLASLKGNEANDPRMITLPLTEYGAMYPNSHTPTPISIPIVGFDAFYVTGWWGDPCASPTVESAHADSTTLSNGTTLLASTDDTPPNDIDEGEGEIDDNAYTENSAGNNSGGSQGQSTNCSSSLPGYNPTLSSGSMSFCTDQGLLLGHFVKLVQTSSQGVASSTACTPSTLGICVAVLNK
ncbi:MAG: hypothetical protein ACLP0J_15535 [Solirubrobacteraceae bacterium]